MGMEFDGLLMDFEKKIGEAFQKLLEYCVREDFKGWDPFDGLNSPVIQKTFLKRFRMVRLAWIQLLKRFPINLRPCLGIQKEWNPKGLGLFVSGFCLLHGKEPQDRYRQWIEILLSRLDQLQEQGYNGACWGYNFDWQARAFFQPKGTPTIVASTYIAHAYLDAYELFGNPKWLRTARSTCDFILSDLNRWEEGNKLCFSYSPLDRSCVYNATLLGSRLLARVFFLTGENKLIDPAEKSIRFAVEGQRSDGAWPYGTFPFHQWVDSFHTGFNLECLWDFMRYSRQDWPSRSFEKGLRYYLENFFMSDGTPKYYDNRIYPIDIHSPAQFLIALSKIRENSILINRKELIKKILLWTIENMQAPDGYFYYQKGKRFFSRIPYMRWAQSWMFLALSFSLNLFNEKKEIGNEGI